jgi:monoamine oxidase
MSQFNRRKLLKLVGRAGGVAAVYSTMKALNLLDSPAKAIESPKLTANEGKGIKVAILGAGIAGMTAAYELGLAGYDCTILEASDRAGGRCWTIRAGTEIEELVSKQTCPFDSSEHLYFNPGPARIPHHHQGILNYCQEFGVPLQVFVNENRATYFQDAQAFGGQAILNRRVVNDSRGYMAELLAKAINQKALDTEIQAEDRERLLEFVSSYGNLSQDYRYEGTERAGYSSPPGAALTPGKLYEQRDFSELLKSDFWGYKLHFGEGYTHPTTMLEPVGGMDRIATAFTSRVGDRIKYNAVVKQMRQTVNGVSVVYQERETGQQQELTADYAICTFPLPVLEKIKTDFSPQLKQAIAKGTNYTNAVKVGFQAEQRFWEQKDHIYGGISWTEEDITQIWYPSSGFHQEKGIIVGAYIWDNSISEPWGKMMPAQRLEKAIANGAKVHPNYREVITPAMGITIAWEKMPYSLGAWADWEEEDRDHAYRILNQVEGPIYLAGEHLSYLTGWQEGAVLSAYQALAKITAKVKATQA